MIGNELLMLKYIFFLNIYNLFLVFMVSFDVLMLFFSVFYKKEFRDWVEYFSDLV